MRVEQFTKFFSPSFSTFKNRRNVYAVVVGYEGGIKIPTIFGISILENIVLRVSSCTLKSRMMKKFWNHCKNRV